MIQEDKNLIEQEPKKLSLFKRSVTEVVIASMIISIIMPAFLYPLKAQAITPMAGAAAGSGGTQAASAAKKAVKSPFTGQIQQSVMVFAPITNSRISETNSLISAFQTGVETIAAGFDTRDWSWKALGSAVNAAAKSALHYLLNTMAFDIATWLASAGSGQTPMFFTDNWGDYLYNLVDGAAGKFLETVSDDFLGFNLCNPSSMQFKINLGLGIGMIDRPTAPDCTVTELMKNWQNFATDPNFLDHFQMAFDPEKNDFGIAISMFGKQSEYKTKVRNSGEEDRKEGAGTKPVKSRFGKILTPHWLVSEEGRQMLAKGTITEEQLDYGDIFYNAIGGFVSTLAGKLLERIFKEGLALIKGGLTDTSSSSGSGTSKLDKAIGLIKSGEELGNAIVGLLNKNKDNDLYTGESGTTIFVGKQGSEERFQGLLKAGIVESGPYDVLSKMVVCVDSKNPGPDECVFNQKFSAAVQKKETLSQAIANGDINGDAPFGYKATSIEEGIPYRSILILKAHRIIPVGWELAAKVANEFYPGETWTLNKLIAEYNREGSAFKGLIDQDWVLEIPDHYCKAQGFGSKIISEKIIPGKDENKDGDYNDNEDVEPSRSVSREQYCADFQTCIQTASDGSCLYYGYCSEEKRIWDLQGTKCPKEYNTCQTFQAPDSTIVSYLKNSIDYNGCNSENAGCQWYCTDFNPVNNIWSCVSEGKKVLNTCTEFQRDANGVVGCIMQATCKVDSGKTFCNDSTKGIRLDISQPCSNTTKWWNQSEGLCNVTANCTIPKGGVACQVTGCEGMTNLLGNPGFEAPGSAIAVPPTVSAKWAGNLAYFRQTGSALDQVYSGKTSLRFYNSGTSVDESVTSGTLTLDSTKTYTFTGYIYNTLNSGEISISIENGINPQTGLGAVVNVPTVPLKKWQQISVDFTVGATPVDIKINVKGAGSTGQVSGTAWFDQFKISESCVTNPIVLSMVGNIDKDESKLHLDRDAVACPPEAVGCSKFIGVKAGAGSNLIRNSGFEYWTDTATLPSGWQPGRNGNIGGSQERVAGHTGNYAFKINNGTNASSRAFESAPILNLKPNATYKISLWAKSENPTDSNGQWFAELIYSPGAQAVSLPIGNPNFSGLTTEWQRLVFDPVTLPVGYDFTLSFNNIAANGTVATTITIDDLQIEEVDVRNPAATEYKDFGASNVSYLKKAPDALSCHGYSKTRPNPNILKNVTKDQCVGSLMVWRKFCSGGDKDGLVCGTDADCTRVLSTGTDGLCRADNCDATGSFCCHEIDSPECNNYANYCQADEVGCQLFTPVSDTNYASKIPSVANYTDYCPAECVGYDAFYQSKTFLERTESIDYFIPATARSCSAAEAGCDQFTNLDEQQSGGESREYYKYLRLCKKAAEPTANCQSFYTWQGSDEAGYQLKSYSLSSSIQAADMNAPVNVLTAANLPDDWCADKNVDANGNPACCNGPEDIANNPFCKEMFGTDSRIFYRIYVNTVSCSDNCHPYRKTRIGTDEGLDSLNCTESSGIWDATNKFCTYQAIPNEGIMCSAAGAGCREYRGNASGNIYTAFADNFEDGDTMGWGVGSISSEALSVGGHSIKSVNKNVETTVESLTASIPSSITCTTDIQPCSDVVTNACYNQQLRKCVSYGRSCMIDLNNVYCSPIGEKLTAGKTYLISFWAKASKNSTEFKAQFINDLTGTPSANDLGSVNISNEWNYYLIGPIDATKTANINSTAKLKFVGDEDYNLDNIQVREVQNYVYAIKGSWKTPVSCDTNPFLLEPISAPQFMLGCKQYRDLNNQIHNLKSFTSLCREEAVGCEAMVDTYNTQSPFEQIFQNEDPLAKVRIPADKISYIVNRSEYQCVASYLGCQKLGNPIVAYNDVNQAVVTGFQDTYLLNNPDNYNNILCGNGEVGCQEYQTNDGYAYFKDPKSRTCEYKLIPGKNVSAWFRTDIATSTPNCPMVIPPVGEPHPGQGFAGTCPTTNNSCSLFIDPVSDISKNLIFNGDLSYDVDKNNLPDGWSVSSSDLIQKVPLNHRTLYTISLTQTGQNRVDKRVTVTLEDCTGLTSFDNSLTISSNSAAIPSTVYLNDPRTVNDVNNIPDERSYTGRFYVPTDKVCTLKLKGVTTKSDAQTYLKKIAIRTTGQYYVLENTIDKLTCNGTVNPKSGCVLFNDRSQVNYHQGENDISYLSFDADASGIDKNERPINNGLAVNNTGNSVADSNSVLKVVPDRTCATWLYCSSYVNEVDDKSANKKYCNGISLCEAADSNGNCTSFVNLKKDDDRIAAYSDPEQFKNFSGYSKPGINLGSPASTVVGNYPFAEMKQIGGIGYSPTTNFESNSQRPYGWNLECPLVTNPEVKDFSRSVWRPEYVRTIYDPVTAQREGLPATAPEGKGFIKLNGPYTVTSEKIEVFGGTEYTISAYVNTQKLIKGQARIIVEEYDQNDEKIAIIGENGTELNNLRQETAKEWTFRIAKFTTDPSTLAVKIKLENWGPTSERKKSSCSNLEAQVVHNVMGSTYFDDIKLRPNLEISRDNIGNQIFAAPTCRVFPESKSLSCNYWNDEGYHSTGWLGYCIETDPINSGQCLLWWPVDLIDGGYISEEPPIAQQPLYYCLGSKESHYRYHACLFEDGDLCASVKHAPEDKSAKSRNFTWTIPGDWRMQKWQIEKMAIITSISDCGASDQCGKTYGKYYLFPNPKSKNEYFTPGVGARAFLKFGSGDLLESIDFEITGPNCFCSDADIEVEIASPWCQYVTQTITPYGQNKAWWNRIGNFSGQVYSTTGNGFLNLFDYKPFGAIVPPYPLDDPSSWDLKGDGDLWSQPLRVEKPQSDIFIDPFQARAGVPASCSQASGDPRFQANCQYPQMTNSSSGATISNTKNSQGKASLQRLFAKSFGIWEFQGDGVCKDMANNVLLAPDLTPESCACPESSCGIDTNVDLKICSNNGAACEVSFMECLDWTQFVNTITSLLVEGVKYTSAGMALPAMIAILAVQFVSQLLLACGPKPCSTSQDCGADEGTCINLAHYLLYSAGAVTDEETVVDLVFNFIFGQLLDILGTAGSDGPEDATSFAGILQSVVDNGENNEAILEGKSGTGVVGQAMFFFSDQISLVLGTYCSQTAFRCQLGNLPTDTPAGPRTKRCCPFGGCNSNIVKTYHCLAGPNKGMICDPTSSQDNCNSGGACKVRTANESYLPVETAWGASVPEVSIPKELKSWREPSKGNICINGRRPLYQCQGGTNAGKNCSIELANVCSGTNQPCLVSADCPTGSNCTANPINTDCPGTSTCAPVNTCFGGLRDNMTCSSPADCPGAGAVCASVKTCDAGDRIGLPCFDDVQCVGGLCKPNLKATDYCSIPPKITSIKVNGAKGFDLPIYGGDFISLTFTVKIDPQQLPLIGYNIDWGDGTQSSLSGQALLSRENEKKPFVASHIYNYWDLKAVDNQKNLNCWAKFNPANPAVDNNVSCCHDGGPNNTFCAVLPRIQVKDNWNWCNNSNDLVAGSDAGYWGNDCNLKANKWKTWLPYGNVSNHTGEIRVYPN